MSENRLKVKEKERPDNSSCANDAAKRTEHRVTRDESKAKKAKRIEDPWFKLRRPKKDLVKLEEEARVRAQHLLNASELGTKPISNFDRNVDGIKVSKKQSTSDMMKKGTKSAVRFVFVQPEVLELQRKTQELHKKFAPTIDYSYEASDGPRPCLYKQFRLPNLC
mmetsp:Transcript_9026/g.13451  ORF Transcript_9026/g.13451 Transcript_9026/m.13451 type:complete len:165 (-) Transcript_9026:655-1149(-)